MDIRLTNFVANKIAISDSMMREVASDGSELLTERRLVGYLETKTDAFCRGKKDRWVIVPGLRGTGKTTAMAQVYLYTLESKPNARLLYLSVDDAMVMGFSLREVLDEYYRQLNIRPLEANDIYLMLDEVQSDNQWASTLKVLYDSAPGTFIICSGSSAINLQVNADIAGRRAEIINMYPMSFTEFEQVRRGKQVDAGLVAAIQSALFGSASAEECYEALSHANDKVVRYGVSVGPDDWSYYLKRGSLPYTIDDTDPIRSYKDILSTVDKVVSKDLPQIGAIDARTVVAARRLIQLLADADTVSVNKIIGLLSISKATVMSILDSLCKAGLLLRVTPYGSNFSAARKNYKYLFASSSIRQALNYSNGSAYGEQEKLGRLLEDAVGLYLVQLGQQTGAGDIFYDSAEGGADFIVRVGADDAIAIESGSGDKTSRQIDCTMDRVSKIRYGITICGTDRVYLAANKKSVFVPWSTFALAC